MPSGIAPPIAPATPPQRGRHAVVLRARGLDDVLVVAGEELVAAVAGQHDLDVLGRQLRHHVGRNRRRVAERLVEIPRRGPRRSDTTSGFSTSSWWSVPNALGDLARVRELVEPGFGEADRERLHAGPAAGAAIVATTALESMPPLRNAPTGTSLTWCSATDSASSSRSCSTSSPSVARLVRARTATSQ